MNLTNRMRRREALGLAGALVSNLALAAETDDPARIARKPSPEFHGLMIGLASYSTRNLSVDDTIACCKRAAVKHIALKDAHLKLTSTRDERAALRQKFHDAGIQIVGCGVIYVKNDETEIRQAFEYTRDLGAATAVIGCTRDVVPAMSKIVKAFDLRVAIHNHGPTDDRGSKSPIDVAGWLTDADPKIGLCMDVGHTFRCGIDPASIASRYASRLYDIHIKDQASATANGRGVPVGQGVIDIVGLLKTLVKTKYPYHVALEYEVETNAPVAGIVESVGFERGVLAAL